MNALVGIIYSFVAEQGVLTEFLTGTSFRAECSGLSDLYDDLLDQSVCTQDLVLQSPQGTDETDVTDYTGTNPDSFIDVRSDYAT